MHLNEKSAVKGQISTEGDRILLTVHDTSREGACTFEATFLLHDDGTYVEYDKHRTPHRVKVGRVKTWHTSGTRSWDRSRGKLELGDRESFSSEACKEVVRNYLHQCGYQKTRRGFWRLLFGRK